MDIGVNVPSIKINATSEEGKTLLSFLDLN